MLDLEFTTNLRNTVSVQNVNEYVRVAKDLKYQRFTKVLPSTTLKQTFVNLLEGAVIRDYGQDGGGVRFEDQAIGSQSYINHVFKSGWKESEYRFKDLDASGIIGGEGIQLLSEWMRFVSARAAYQPQHLSVLALRNGTSTSMTVDGQVHELVCYDGLPLFSQVHPYNFKRTSLGTFCNYFKGAPASTVANNIGFLPLAGPFKKNASTGEWEYDADSSVSIEDAWENLWTMIVAIRAMKMADGLTPRHLKASGIVAGPRLLKALTTLLNAQFIATAPGGSTDIKATITALGLSEPIILDELIGLSTAREEWDWYIVCEEAVNAATIGCINVGFNEPWTTKIFTSGSGAEGVNLELAIEDAVVAIGKMRMFVGVGQPQFIFKTEAPR